MSHRRAATRLEARGARPLNLPRTLGGHSPWRRLGKHRRPSCGCFRKRSKKRKRELENTRAQEKRRRRTEEALASQLLIYMWVAVGQVDDAVRMFRNSSSHPLAGQASEASLRRLMADLFWRADLEHILALMSREDSSLTNIRSEAYGLHAECLTAARVRELNLTCGVAPSSLAVCWMYDEFLEQAPEDISRARSRLAKTWVSNRKWVER